MSVYIPVGKGWEVYIKLIVMVASGEAERVTESGAPKRLQPYQRCFIFYKENVPVYYLYNKNLINNQ